MMASIFCSIAPSRVFVSAYCVRISPRILRSSGWKNSSIGRLSLVAAAALHLRAGELAHQPLSLRQYSLCFGDKRGEDRRGGRVGGADDLDEDAGHRVGVRSVR